MRFDITAQTDLEEKYSKYQLHSRIREEFIDADFPAMCKDKEIPAQFGVDLMVELVLRKRAGVAVLVGILQRHFKNESHPKQACADMILEAIHADFCDWDDANSVVVIRYDISDDVKEQLDMFQYPLPMIEEPNHVFNNKQTGYQTIHGSLLLKNTHTDLDICLDHINRSNAVPLSINSNVVAFLQNKWKGIDHQKDDEDLETFVKRTKAFQKYDRTSKDILAAMLALGNRLWLTHKYDFRGRSYSQGYHVNYQGNDWNKAMIQFAETEVLNAT